MREILSAITISLSVYHRNFNSLRPIASSCLCMDRVDCMKIPSAEERSSHGLEYCTGFSVLLSYLITLVLHLSSFKFENSFRTCSVLNPYCLIPITTLTSCETSSTNNPFFPNSASRSEYHFRLSSVILWLSNRICSVLYSN